MSKPIAKSVETQQAEHQVAMTQMTADAVIGELEQQHNMLRTRATQLAAEIAAHKMALQAANEKNRSLVECLKQQNTELEELRKFKAEAECDNALANPPLKHA